MVVPPGVPGDGDWTDAATGRRIAGDGANSALTLSPYEMVWLKA